ncbi:hypothetical protein NKI32_07865 [Mesorhizobium sp. M0761]|uniref:hypothetical protein n=1 Tax=Mesorhizobium sp. M0761 TaxID=2956994 RepID=UPI003338AF69
MKPIVWLAAAGAFSACAVGASIATGFYNPFDSKMTRICEDMLTDRLRSPSSYRRIEISHYSDQIPVEEFRKIKEAEIVNDKDYVTLKRILDLTIGSMSKNHLPVMFKKYIKYDADNAYGTPIRGLAECTLLAENGKESSASVFDVRLDGTTKTEYLTKLILESQQN